MSRTAINAGLSISQVVSALISPFVGKILDSQGPRVVGSVSLVFIASCFGVLSGMAQADVLTTFPTNSTTSNTSADAKLVVHYYAAYLLAGLGFAGAAILQGGKLVGNWFPAKRGRVMGIVTSGNNFGGLIMSQLSSRMALSVGWRWAAATFALIMVVLAIAYRILVRDMPPPTAAWGRPAKREKSEERKNGPGALGTEAGQARADLSLTEAYHQFHFWATGLGMTCAFATYSGILSQLIPALIAEGFDDQDAANCLAVVAALGVCSKVICGRASETLTARRTVIICLLIQVVAIVLFCANGWWLGRITWLYWASSALYGMGFGGIGALLPLVAMETFGIQHYGVIYGTINSAYVLPNLIMPLIAGGSF
jgi:MFS family permease